MIEEDAEDWEVFRKDMFGEDFIVDSSEYDSLNERVKQVIMNGFEGMLERREDTMKVL